MIEQHERWRDEIGAQLEALADRMESELAGSAAVARRTLGFTRQKSKDVDVRSVDIKPRNPDAAWVGWLDMVSELQIGIGGRRGVSGRWELDRTVADVRFIEDVVAAPL